MFGYSSGTAQDQAFFGEGEWGTDTCRFDDTCIWMDELGCTGDESSIFDCNYDNGFNRWGQHDCDHSEDAGVECRNRGMNPILGSNFELAV